MKTNYQKELDALLASLESVPTLFLHSCCAPCSTYVIEYLSRFFSVTVFYFNPNIYPREEYLHRLDEEKRFITEYKSEHPVSIVEGDYIPETFESCAAGLENEREGGERCGRCYELRLAETARVGAQRGFDYFTTTLSVSPWKNAQKINDIGANLERQYPIRFLRADFKKKDGYKRSIELSSEYRLYRQDYCGCRYSLAERDLLHKPE